MIKKLIGCMFVGLALTLIDVFCLYDENTGQGGVIHTKNNLFNCYVFIQQRTYGYDWYDRRHDAETELLIKRQRKWMLYSIEFVGITFIIIIFVAGIVLICSKPKTK